MLIENKTFPINYCLLDFGMNDNNSILEKLVNLAKTKGFLTLSDIEEVLPAEFKLEGLDDLYSSILEMGIQVEDNGIPIKIKLKPVNNNQDIRPQNLLSHKTLEITVKTKRIF